MQWFPGDDLLVRFRPRGLPIGKLTSQFFAKVYLHPLDMFVKHTLQVRHYLRYVDDFLLFGDASTVLHRYAERIGEFLTTLRLRLHPSKCWVFPVQTGVNFVGYVNFPSHRRVRRAGVIRMRRRLRELRGAFAAGVLGPARVRAAVHSWLAHASHADARGLSRVILRDAVFWRG